MKEFLNIRHKREQTANLLGVILAVALPGGSAATLSFTGLKYIYPPPEETSFVVDFTEEKETFKNRPRGIQPRAEQVDKSKPVTLVQRSESPYKAQAKNNVTTATRPDDFGDVETPAVEQEDALDPRASFPGMSKKDTTITAPHASEEASDALKAGQPQGNTVKGRTEGTANARLKGRNTVGNLPRPGYNVQNEGVVVVTIWVDKYGAVKKALPGAEGTTVTDKNLWAAARNAAMETHFSQNLDAPALQEGTITYIFKLK